MEKRKKIICNAVRCNTCQDYIESLHVHDFFRCSCGNIAVDGGHEYLRRVGNIKEGSYKDLSIELDDID